MDFDFKIPLAKNTGSMEFIVRQVEKWMFSNLDFKEDDLFIGIGMVCNKRNK